MQKPDSVFVLFLMTSTRRRPYVSPDGNYFFFMSARTNSTVLTGFQLTFDKLRELHNTPGTGLPGIYWMDASFLAGLRP